MRKARTLANQSIQSMVKQITLSFIDQITQREEVQTEGILIALYCAIIERKKTFAELFAAKAFDIPMLKHDPLVKNEIRGEIQWLRQEDFFDVMEKDLAMTIEVKDKMGFVNFCAKTHFKTKMILLRY
jgi:hypothetical protein